MSMIQRRPNVAGKRPFVKPIRAGFAHGVSSDAAIGRALSEAGAESKSIHPPAPMYPSEALRKQQKTRPDVNGPRTVDVAQLSLLQQTKREDPGILDKNVKPTKPAGGFYRTRRSNRFWIGALGTDREPASPRRAATVAGGR